MKNDELNYSEKISMKTIRSKRINYTDKKEIKRMFFNWEKVWTIAVKTRYTNALIKKYVSWRATKEYTNKQWIRFDKCSVCQIYRKLDMYYSAWKNKLSCKCKICQKLIGENYYNFQKNNWLLDNTRKRKSYKKWGWKYNSKDKILRILAYHKDKISHLSRKPL